MIESSPRPSSGRPAKRVPRRLAFVALAATALAATVAFVRFASEPLRPSPGGAGPPSPARVAIAASSPEGPAAVKVASAERRAMRRSVTVPAEITAFEETAIHSRVEGFVRAVHVDLGDVVPAGKILAELDAPELDASLRQAAALEEVARAGGDQAAASATAAEAEVGSAEARVAECEAAVRRAEAELERVKLEDARVADLARENAVEKRVAEETAARLLTAEAARDEARAGVLTARARLEEAKAKVLRAAADRIAAAAALEAARAATQHAKVMVEYATIRSPYDCVVTRRHVHPGHFASGGGRAGPLLEIVRKSPVRVLVPVPEREAVAVAPGQRALVEVQALAGETFEGAVTRTAWALDRATRTLRVAIDIDNAQGKLRPSLYANATIVLEEHAAALAVRASAVVRSQPAPYVCVVRDGRIERVQVALGIAEEDFVEVLSGLAEGDAVVVENPAALRSGQEVNATKS